LSPARQTEAIVGIHGCSTDRTSWRQGIIK
jgi:hypothetical protein